MADLKRVLMRAGIALNTRVYRASGGKLMGKVRGVPVLLLTVAGRNSGDPHTTPVSYFRVDRGFVVTGSAGGSASEPQWFRNLRRADRAVIEVGQQRMDVTVAIAGTDERTVLWKQLLARAAFFAGYQEKVDREIPMAVLTPIE